MKFFLILFGIVLLYRFTFCLSGLLRTVFYEQKYKKYIKREINNFALYTTPANKLFKQAHVKDMAITRVESVGGYLRAGDVSVFDNISVRRDEVIEAVLRSFSEAKGTFRMGLLECFSPLFWIHTVVFLPIKLCEFMGLSEKKVLSKILQVAYWFLTPIFIIFRDELYQLIVRLLQ